MGWYYPVQVSPYGFQAVIALYGGRLDLPYLYMVQWGSPEMAKTALVKCVSRFQVALFFSDGVISPTHPYPTPLLGIRRGRLGFFVQACNGPIGPRPAHSVVAGSPSAPARRRRRGVPRPVRPAVVRAGVTLELQAQPATDP